MDPLIHLPGKTISIDFDVKDRDGATALDALIIIIINGRMPARSTQKLGWGAPVDYYRPTKKELGSIHNHSQTAPEAGLRRSVSRIQLENRHAFAWQMAD